MVVQCISSTFLKKWVISFPGREFNQFSGVSNSTLSFALVLTTLFVNLMTICMRNSDALRFFPPIISSVSYSDVIICFCISVERSANLWLDVCRMILTKYISESRNLKKVSNFERRSKLLHVGKTEVVRFLNTLPKTQHDLPSFTVDLTIFRVSAIFD